MEKLTLYNSLSRQDETFKPIAKGKVGLYTCGPTVYWYQHIGNLRTYIFSDILKRVLSYNKYKVNHIINITDVGHLTSDADEGEDKMEKAAAKEGKSAQQIADHYFKVFHSDLHKLNILDPKKWTKATEHIKEQIELIKTLEKKKYTYKTSDGIYFDTSRVKGYGQLANIQPDAIKAGKRVNVGEKKHNTDFALWKFSLEQSKRQQEWPSPWGVGFPGWHIECSAMSMKYLSEHFDIHTGGEDHRQIHHVNEIAQSESASGKKFVNYWLHGAFLLFKGEKVSKSSGGLYTLSELETMGYNPMHFRYLCLLTHYRKPLNFTLENLDAAKTAFERLKRRIIEIKKENHKGEDKTSQYKLKFQEAINNDLNMPQAIQAFIETLEDFNFDHKKKIFLLEKFDSVLGLGIKDFKESSSNIPHEVKELVEERERLRYGKLYKEADIVRQRIKDLGYELEDSPQGQKVRKI